MTGSTFWSIIFFLMLITLGLDSTFGGLEAMITALCDEFPNFIGKRRELFVLILLAFIYICALPTMTYVSNRLIEIEWIAFQLFWSICGDDFTHFTHH
jgi:SNF family Na+-dependent transporter